VSEQEILNQDEIDALLNGVEGGQISTSDEAAPSATPRSYDFSNEMRIVRGRMPTLEMVNERFARLFRNNLYSLLRQTSEVAVTPLSMKKFGEYLRTLEQPTSLNTVRINPLRGSALVVLTPALVFAIVDKFFGGSGRHSKIDGRDFTAAESRVIELLLKGVYADLKVAWSPVLAIDIEFLSAEMNPQFANIVSPSEIVVVNSFHVDLDGAQGDLHVTLPYAMIEPMREQLDSGMHSDHVESDGRWYRSLREEIEHAEVSIRTVLGRSELTLGKLLGLKPGDVVPFDFEGQATVYAEDIPIFRGGFGGSRGNEAVKVEERVRRTPAARSAPIVKARAAALR
jgi:flagellar motor switch protein FliM